MKVHQLIEILQKQAPDAEVIVGSHTLQHPSCNQPVGVWPACGVENGEFVHGGPLGDQNNWVKILASDAWGVTLYTDKDQTIRVFATVPLERRGTDDDTR